MSGVKVMPDTNVVLYLLNGDETLADFLDDKDLYVSVITEMELLSYRGISDEEIVQVQGFLSQCTPVNITHSVKAEAIRIRRKYGNKLPDSIIAATASVLDIPIITADGDFSRIEEVSLIFYER